MQLEKCMFIILMGHSLPASLMISSWNEEQKGHSVCNDLKLQRPRSVALAPSYRHAHVPMFFPTVGGKKEYCFY